MAFVWSIAIIVGMVLLIQAIPTSLRPSLLLLYNGGFLVPVAGLLLVLSLLWELPTQLWYYHRSRQAARTGTDLPGRAALPARLRGLLERLNGLLFRLYPALCLVGLVTSFFSGNGRIDLPPERHREAAAYPVVLAADLGLGQPAESIQISQGGSVLASYIEYRDYTGRSSPSPGWITSNTYRCTWNWVADLLTQCLLWEERSGNANHIAHHGESLPLEPVSLDFDVSWIYQNGGMTYLLLRQGKTVAVVEAPADLTTPEALAVLYRRLGLDSA